MYKFSKNEGLLLRLFFSSPDREFYIQEIGRVLGRKPGSFQRMLYQLEGQGILSSRYSANARYFRANRDHPLFEEIKSIVFKTVGIAGSLREALAGVPGIEFAFIYGSYAKGQERPDSDIDLMIIGTPDENILLERLEALESSLGREINYQVRTSLGIVEASPESQPFLVRILKEPKVFLFGQEDELRALAKGRADQDSGP
jgi:predicted nucleotidyltransferase